MNAESLFPIFFFAVFSLVVGSFLYKMLKHGGFKAAMFGAPIERTVGEVAGGGMKLMNIGLKVHKLGGGREKAVGVELVAKSFASYQMMPVTLSTAEARKLIMLLEAATGGQNAT